MPGIVQAASPAVCSADAHSLSSRRSALGSLQSLPLELRLMIYSLALEDYADSSMKTLTVCENDPTLKKLSLLHTSRPIFDEVAAHCLIAPKTARLHVRSPVDACHLLFWASQNLVPGSSQDRLVSRIGTLRLGLFDLLTISRSEEWDIRNLSMFDGPYKNKLELRLIRLSAHWAKALEIVPSTVRVVELDLCMWMFVTNPFSELTFSRVPKAVRDKWLANFLEPLQDIIDRRTSGKADIVYILPETCAKCNLPYTGRQRPFKAN